MDFRRGILDLLSSHLELIVKGIGPIDQSLSLLVEDVDPWALSIALLLPFWESAIALVDIALLPLSQFLLPWDFHS